MKCLIIIVSSLLTFQLTSSAQGWKQKLKITLLNADSVKILSHKTTSGIRITKQHRDEQDLIIQGRLNKGIVNMLVLLDHRSVEKLIQILTSINSDKEIEIIKSFTPHHGIIIYRKNRISWMDVDFPARQISTSSDIIIGDYLSKRSWEDLERLFRSRRLDF